MTEKNKVSVVQYAEFEALFADKVSELTDRINKLKTDDNISKNTRGTQLYAKKRERSTVQLLQTAFKQAKQLSLTEAEHEKLVSLLTLTSERSFSSVKIEDGDSVLKLMQEYSEVKDVYGKLMKYAATHNFTYDPASGIFTKDVDVE